MFSPVAIVLCVILGQAPEEPLSSDLILLKDGTKRAGLIVEETDEAVVLQVTIKGSKGDVTGKLRIAKDQIAEIRRMPAEARDKGKAGGPLGRDERRAKIVISSVTIGGSPWLLATGEQNEVQTTCDEDFARDVCDALDQAYAGYLRGFKPRREGTGKQRVILLPGRAEYDEYLKRTYGATVLDPATYRAKDLLIACDCIQKDEAARMRSLVRERRKQIDDVRKNMAAAEERHRAMVKGARQEVIDNVNKEKEKLRQEGKATPEALRELEGKKKAALELAEAMGKVFYDQDPERTKATATIKECEEAIRKNELVLRSQNRVMFETLFHESFHAFVQNRLGEIPRWLNEGMACCVEASVVENGELVRGAPNAALLALYREQEQKGQLPKIETVLRAGADMFRIPHEGRIDRTGGACAVSWAVADYLGSALTAEQMDAYVTDVASGKDAADALAKALGLPLGTIDEAVRAHVAALK